MDADARARLRALFDTVLDPARRERFDHANGWLYRSMGRYREAGRERIFAARVQRLLSPVWDRRRDLVFLDVGCGFGFTEAALALLGARRAIGVETAAGCLATCRALAELVPDLPVEFHDARAEDLPFDDGSVDAVFAVEAISHFVAPWRFLDEAWRVLARGGLLVIADDNNLANPRQRQQLEDVWERFEAGPPTHDIHGHRVVTPYVARRREILRTHFPDAPHPELEQLSRSTSGLWGDALLDAGRRYFAHAGMPRSVYRRGVCPVDPSTGAFMENPLDPREIGRRLAAHGARVDVRPYFGGESRGGIVRAADAAVRLATPRRVALRFARGYRVYARKR